MPSVSIVICTYNRPGPLREALVSALSQALPPGFDGEVVVVDNSRDANARAAVEALAAQPGGLPLRYLSAPEPNVSLARNTGVAASGSDYVVFLDDDQWFEPGCVAALLGTAERTGADLVFGPVLADFPGGMPDWDPEGKAYERLVPWPTGTTAPLRLPGNQSGRWIATGNLAARRATALAGPQPFDPELGTCGGEDFDLFSRLDAAGRRFVWCAEAVAHEPVPPGRATLAYMCRRACHNGKIYGTMLMRNSSRPLLTAANLTARALVQCVLTGGRLAWARLRGHRSAARHALKLADVSGKLVWWSLSRQTPW
jgi:succinoglycan biosynthesis protein ExoM